MRAASAAWRVAVALAAAMPFALPACSGKPTPSPSPSGVGAQVKAMEEDIAVSREANAAAASLNAAQAERQLSAYQAEHGTFAGAAITGISGVTLLRADATSFCLQLNSSGGVLYDAGPGGTPTTQHC